MNISPRQFADNELISYIGEILAMTGVAPHLLELEITESMVMHDAESVIATLQGLKALGVRLSVDDFGTGYSSLSYLATLPIDALKIDRSFIERMSREAEGSDIRVQDKSTGRFGTRCIHAAAIEHGHPFDAGTPRVLTPCRAGLDDQVA